MASPTSPSHPPPLNSPTKAKPFASLLKASACPSQPSPLLTLIFPSIHHGEPALKIPQSLVTTLSKPFSLALIGKFSNGRPTMERSCLFFNKLGLRGNFTLGHLDPKYMLIRLEDEGDFNHLCIKELLMLEGFPLRIFRWTADFRPEVESPIVLVFVSLPNLPIFLFDKTPLFSIGRLIGSLLTIDMATANIKRPSLAKICVEIDLLKSLPSRVWLECGDVIPGFWLEIEYDKIPNNLILSTARE